MSISRLQLAKKLQRSVELAGGSVSTYFELFAKGENHIGIRAAKDVPAFQCLASVPLRLCVAESTITQSDESASSKLITALVTRKLALSRADTGTAGALQAPPGFSSVFTEYFRLLPPPDQLTGFPAYWQPQHWAGLTNSTLYHMHKNSVAQVRRIFDDLAAKDKGDGLGEVTMEDCQWAEAVVGSRCFGAGRATALVPLLDLLDHDQDVSCLPLGSTGCIVVRAPFQRQQQEQQEQQEGEGEGEGEHEAYHLFSLADIPRGQELCVSYGELSLASSLHGYGFVPPPPPPDQEEASRGGLFELALPVLPSLTRRGRLHFSYEVFDLDEAYLAESVGRMLKAGVGRAGLGAAVQRRLRVVQGLLVDLQQQQQQEEGEGEGVVSPELKRRLLQDELRHLRLLEASLQQRERTREEAEAGEERLEERVLEALHFAREFRAHTGLDIAAELLDDPEMTCDVLT